MSIYENPFENQPAMKPACKYIQWSGSRGQWEYWDKEAAENKTVGQSLAIIPLMQYKTVKGFCEPENSGIYANEVLDTRAQILRVKTHNGVEIAEGLWKAIADKVGRAGGKFAISVYAYVPALKEIANITFSGSSLSCWIENKAPKIGTMCVLTRKGEQSKKGSNLYWEPMLSVTTGKDDAQRAKIEGAKAEAMAQWPAWAKYLKERDDRNGQSTLAAPEQDAQRAAHLGAVAAGNKQAIPAPAFSASADDLTALTFGQDAEILANQPDGSDDLPF